VEEKMILELLLQMLYCFGASFFYALIMNAPKKTLVHSSVIASLGYLIYIVCVNNGNLKLGFLLGTAFITFLGELYARKFKMPATIFIFPGIIPIVPGLGLYETMYEFVQNDISAALEVGVNTLVNIGAMAIAMAMVSLIVSKIKFNKN
jgi:uncharacterized membrane protein YjjB (DUF3815 family)